MFSSLHLCQMTGELSLTIGITQELLLLCGIMFEIGSDVMNSCVKCLSGVLLNFIVVNGYRVSALMLFQNDVALRLRHNCLLHWPYLYQRVLIGVVFEESACSFNTASRLNLIVPSYFDARSWLSSFSQKLVIWIIILLFQD